MKKQQEQPVLITDAARSPADEYRGRQIRYVSMMAGRAACLIIGAVLVSVRPPLLSVWLVLCAIGMVFLPWAAVLIANDRPPRTKAERNAGPTPPQRTMLTQQSAETIQHRTIDAEQ